MKRWEKPSWPICCRGINNQTRRARYYSFWAWALNEFRNDENAEHNNQQGFYKWARNREDVLILAYLLHNCGGGIAGTMQAAPIWAEGEPASYSVTWPSLLSVKGGAYELYYRGALGEMNITGKPTDDPNSTDKPSELKHDALTKTVGAKLAEAYAEAVAPSHFVQSLSNATIVRKEDIADFIPYGCICNVSNFEKERRALIDAFFRFDSPDAYAVKRLASLCLFLDIVKNSEGEPLNEDHFRQLLYFWSYGTHHRYDPEGNLLLQAERWRAFQFRQYFVYAYESLWSFFLSSIFGDKNQRMNS